jgi:hypothetical protein
LVVVPEFGGVVPEFGEAVPGFGEAVPGVGDAVPGVGEAVGGLPPVVPDWPWLDVVPEFCPPGEAEFVPACPAFEPDEEPADPADPVDPEEPADPACISGVKTAVDSIEPWAVCATIQHVKNNKTHIIEILVFMGLQASKRE